jgi:hypothetical protein
MNIKMQSGNNPEMTITADEPEGIAAVTSRLGNMTKVLPFSLFF